MSKLPSCYSVVVAVQALDSKVCGAAASSRAAVHYFACTVIHCYAVQCTELHCTAKHCNVASHCHSEGCDIAAGSPMVIQYSCIHTIPYPTLPYPNTPHHTQWRQCSAWNYLFLPPAAVARGFSPPKGPQPSPALAPSLPQPWP